MSKSRDSSLEKWSDVLEALTGVLRQTGMQETVKWGGPVFTHGGKNIVGLGAFKDYVGLWFFNGGLLSDSAGKLQDPGEDRSKAMRQWRFYSVQQVVEDRNIILAYLKEAMENSARGLVVKPTPKPKIESEMLNQALNANDALKNAYMALAPSKQREYAEYIASAKRETTQNQRLAKILPMILEGKGLNDKYKK